MLKRLTIYLAVFGLMNFFVFFVITTWIGGTAIDGFVRGGHYFVSNHGQISEVSWVVFEISKWQGYSAMITFPLAILGMMLRDHLAKR
jgi:hypothetical protein